MALQVAAFPSLTFNDISQVRYHQLPSGTCETLNAIKPMLRGVLPDLFIGGLGLCFDLNIHWDDDKTCTGLWKGIVYDGNPKSVH